MKTKTVTGPWASTAKLFRSVLARLDALEAASGIERPKGDSRAIDSITTTANGQVTVNYANGTARIIGQMADKS